MLELLNVCDHNRSATFKGKRWSNKELSSSDLLFLTWLTSSRASCLWKGTAVEKNSNKAANQIVPCSQRRVGHTSKESYCFYNEKKFQLEARPDGREPVTAANRFHLGSVGKSAAELLPGTNNLWL